MRRAMALLLALPLTTLPALSGPAAAEDPYVFCVNLVDAGCDAYPGSFEAAIDANYDTPGPTEIWLGPGLYDDGPYDLDRFSGSRTTVVGRGPSTVLSAPPSVSANSVLKGYGVTVTDLHISMTPLLSDGDVGLSAFQGSIVERVSVDGTNTTKALGAALGGSQVADVSIDMTPGTDTSGASIATHSVFIDSTIDAATGLIGDGGQASRLTIHASDAGVTAGGVYSTHVDDVLIDLGSSAGTGLEVVTREGVGSTGIHADHVTIVGGGSGSHGVRVAATLPQSWDSVFVNLSNSVIDGPATSIAGEASNDGSQPDRSYVHGLVTYNRFTTVAEDIDPDTGGGGFTFGPGNTTAAPGFVNPVGGDYRLQPGSPLVDRGDPADGGPALDRADEPRVQDGDDNGVPRRDMGAYELIDTTPPQTRLTSAPAALGNASAIYFGYHSDVGATFACSWDDAPYAGCDPSGATRPLGDGPHRFAVRATDVSGNTDATPAAWDFVIDTEEPSTNVTKRPPHVVRKPRVTFQFSSNEPGSFLCVVDGGRRRMKPCPSPFVIRVLPGRHRLRVWAKDDAGNIDRTEVEIWFRRVVGP